MSIAEPASGRPPRRQQGRIASAGLAAGPLVRLEARRTAGAAPGASTPAIEGERLSAALARARSELAEVVAAASRDAADILTFQLALAEDDALSAPAMEAISAGAVAEMAWQAAMSMLIADYAASEEEYFRARVADLRDLEGRVLDALSGGAQVLHLPERAILVADDLTPSLFLSLPWEGRGIALEAGSATSHVAMLARSRNVPMLVGLGPLAVRSGEPALLDATEGILVVSPDREAERRFGTNRSSLEESRAGDATIARRPAITAEGEPVEVHINIADPAELDRLDPAICDGVGLVRTELMFHGRERLPDETEQAEAYARILRWAEGRPVTIRTLDAGGDKPIKGLTVDGEANPFLGVRGVRLSLARLDVFRLQLRALLRAAPSGRLRIMVPMVSLPGEMDRVRSLLATTRAELERERVPCGHADLGMMVEVPAAAIALDLFKTDFVSIGSNDLTQYTMAASRDSDALAELADVRHPAVLRLISTVVEKARGLGIPASLCGDAAGDKHVVPHLLAAGLRSLSVPPSRVGEVKRAISSFRRERPHDGQPGLVARIGRALGVTRSARG